MGAHGDLEVVMKQCKCEMDESWCIVKPRRFE